MIRGRPDHFSSAKTPEVNDGLSEKQLSEAYLGAEKYARSDRGSDGGKVAGPAESCKIQRTPPPIIGLHLPVNVNEAVRVVVVEGDQVVT